MISVRLPDMLTLGLQELQTAPGSLQELQTAPGSSWKPLAAPGSPWEPLRWIMAETGQGGRSRREYGWLMASWLVKQPKLQRACSNTPTAEGVGG